MDPNIRRLAIPVADHSLSYINFEGIIPKGSYGAGLVSIWDNGIFDLISRTQSTIVVFLSGSKLKGEFSIKQFGPDYSADTMKKVKGRQDGPTLGPHASFVTKSGHSIILYLNDCFTGLERLIYPESVDVLVTSPPYNIGIPYNGSDDRIPRNEYL